VVPVLPPLALSWEQETLGPWLGNHCAFQMVAQTGKLSPKRRWAAHLTEVVCTPLATHATLETGPMG
jgi:hypothetical protein